jgi:hypothetical protein
MSSNTSVGAPWETKIAGRIGHSGERPAAARVELDHQIRFHLHRIGHVGQGRGPNEGRLHGLGVDVEIIGDVALGRRRRLEHDGQVARLLLDLDDIAVLHLVGGDVDALAVDPDMAVVDELAGGEHRHGELGAIDHGVEATFEQPDQVGAGVAAAARRLFVQAAELALADVAVIALEALLRPELQAVIGGLAAASLAVLAGSVIALGDRALRPAPQVHAEPAVDLVLRFQSLRHVRSRF